MNASIAGESRNATIMSAATSTALASAPDVICGQTNVLKPVEGFAFVDDAITPPTKSASNTIAAFGGEANALVTDWLKLYWSAPLVPPATFDVSPRIFPIVVSAVFTDGSVHLILCWLSCWYFAVPKVRRYLFWNMSVRVQPSAPPMEYAGFPDALMVLALV